MFVSVYLVLSFLLTVLCLLIPPHCVFSFSLFVLNVRMSTLFVKGYSTWCSSQCCLQSYLYDDAMQAYIVFVCVEECRLFGSLSTMITPRSHRMNWAQLELWTRADRRERLHRTDWSSWTMRPSLLCLQPISTTDYVRSQHRGACLTPTCLH